MVYVVETAQLAQSILINDNQCAMERKYLLQIINNNGLVLIKLSWHVLGVRFFKHCVFLLPRCKTNKYSSLTNWYLFVRVTAETMGTINKDGIDFLSDIGWLEGKSHKAQMTIARAPSSFSDCFNWRYSAVAVMGTFFHTTPEDEI